MAAPVGQYQRWRVSVVKWETGTGGLQIGIRNRNSGPRYQNRYERGRNRTSRARTQTSSRDASDDGRVGEGGASAARKATRGEGRQRATSPSDSQIWRPEVRTGQRALQRSKRAVEREKLCRRRPRRRREITR